MDYIRGTSARGQKIIGMYNQYAGTNLGDVYGNYSNAKHTAFIRCWQMYLDDNRSANFHICSHNSHNFTVGWRYIDPVTNHKIIRVETSRNTYRVDSEV